MDAAAAKDTSAGGDAAGQTRQTGGTLGGNGVSAHRFGGERQGQSVEAIGSARAGAILRG
jgi:hypothetical protein